MDIDGLNDFTEGLTQNADELNVTNNTTSIHQTSNSKTHITKPILNTNDSTDTDQNNDPKDTLTDTLPWDDATQNTTQSLTPKLIVNTNGEECELQ